VPADIEIVLFSRHYQVSSLPPVSLEGAWVNTFTSMSSKSATGLAYIEGIPILPSSLKGEISKVQIPKEPRASDGEI
jgi:hypothetical protein